MNTLKKRKIVIGDRLFFCYFVYCLIILVVEWLYFIASRLQIEVPMGIFECSGVILVSLTLYFSRTFFELKKSKVDKCMVYGCIFILVFGLLMSVYPDNTCDTYNYHLVAQSPKFSNFFSEHFAKGNFQVWGFRLGDRLFYYFRYLLGFRFGTILNVVVLIITYIQIYDMLDAFKKKYNNAPQLVVNILCNKMIWAGILVLMQDALLMIGIYYVDILALPIGCEVIRILLLDREEKPGLQEIAYFAFLNGIWIAFKLTNVYYVIPCVLLYIFLNKKYFSTKIWVVSIVVGLIPFLIYIIHNYMCTGNPVFPYYNRLFDSKYFKLEGFKDPNWGGTNLFEKFFWIFFAVYRPEYRQCEIYSMYNFIILLGIVAASIFTIQYFVKWKNKEYADSELFWLIVVTFLSTLLWSFTSGYSRYFIFGKILWGILAYILCLKAISSKKNMCYFITGVCIIVIIVQTLLTGGRYSYGRNWSWRRWELDTFIAQVREVGRDKKFLKENNYDIDMFCLSDSFYSGIAHLIDEEVYTFIASYFVWLDEPTVMREALSLHKNEWGGKKVDIHRRTFNDVKNYINNVNACGLYIDSFESVYHADMGDYLLATVEEIQGRANTVYISDDEIKIPCVSEGAECMLKFICGRIYDWKYGNIYNMVISLETENKKEEIFSTSVDNVEVNSYQVLFATDEQEYDIVYEFYDSEGKAIENDEINKIFIINPRIVNYE